MKAVSVNQLGKRYLIGHQGSNDTLRDALVTGLSSFWRFLKTRQSRTTEEFWALRDVSFDITSGEVVGIIGRNGAGKSTLLKVLSRITEPTLGEITIRGRVASLLEVGTGFHPELSGRENIFLNGAILGMSRREISRKFDEIVDFAGVYRFLDTPVKRYSSGMYVRLAFAVAAHLEPEILIVDEVLAVGDLEFQRKCLGRMNKVAKDGRTVLFVSHNLAAVQSLCTRGIMLKQGQVVFDGTASDATRHYLSSGTPNDAKVFHGTDPKLALPSVTYDAGLDKAVLKIEMSLISKTTKLVGVEFILHDSTGVAVAFADVGSLNHEATIEIKSQASERRFDIDVFNLANGNYSLSVQLVTKEHGVELRFDYPVLLEFNRQPLPPFQRVLDQKWQAGAVHIPAVERSPNA